MALFKVEGAQDTKHCLNVLQGISFNHKFIRISQQQSILLLKESTFPAGEVDNSSLVNIGKIYNLPR